MSTLVGWPNSDKLFQSAEEEGEPSKRLDLQNLSALILNKTFSGKLCLTWVRI